MTNAVKHGASGETITVRLGRSTEGCRLADKNTGALPTRVCSRKYARLRDEDGVSLVGKLEGRLEASTMAGENGIRGDLPAQGSTANNIERSQQNRSQVRRQLCHRLRDAHSSSDPYSHAALFATA